MSVRTDISIQLVWAIANTEANLAGETRIRPVHFFLGILKLVDPHFLKQLDGVTIPDEERSGLGELSKQIRHYLEMRVEEITRLRRSLRAGLREGKPGQGEIRMLHRTEDSRGVFHEAVAKVVQAGGTTLSALQLAEALFDSGCVNLESLKRPRARPSSKGAKWEILDDGHAKPGTRFTEWCGRNLSRLAHENKLPPFEGREGELRKMLRILTRTGTRHIAVVGKPGVGKTALVEGLARTLLGKKTPHSLTDCELLELHGSDIASDCEGAAEVCRRLSHLFRLLSRRGSAILVLDDFNGLFPAHLKPDAIFALLTTILAEQVTPCIVTTAPAMWKELAAKAPSLARRFHVVQLADPSQQECRDLADAWSKKIAAAQGITFEPAAIAAIVRAASEMPEARAMPDRIVDLIESAATFVTVSALTSGTARKEVTPADITAVLAEQYGIEAEEAPRVVRELRPKDSKA
jgi:ATP-dependent Clp protease ATP-binding subunit ClpA